MARDRPRIVPVRCRAIAAGSTWSRTDLPTRRAEGQGRLAKRLGHGPQRFLGRDHDDRQDQEAKRQDAGQQGRAQREALDAEGADAKSQARGCRKRSTAHRPGWRCWSE